MVRSPDPDHLRTMLLVLLDREVPFIVCGGVAVVLQGGERLTVDLDIAADLSPAHAHRLIAAMAELGLVPRAPVPADVLADEDSVRRIVREKGALVFTFLDPDHPYRQIDVFLTPEHSYASLLPDTELISFEGRHLRVLSRRKLLALKESIRPLREKDIADIAMLRKLIGETGG